MTDLQETEPYQVKFSGISRYWLGTSTGQVRVYFSVECPLVLSHTGTVARTFSCFQSQAITQFNYANPVQLNDSSNNRLSAERWLFLWGSLVFPGIWMAQALAQAIHGSLWKQRDNLFVRRPFHAWLQRCWESLKTFRPPLLRFFVSDSVIGCFVFVLCWLGVGVGGAQSSVGAFFPNLWTHFVVNPCKLAGFVAPERVRTVWTWCKALYLESRFLSLISTAYLAHSSSSPSSERSILFCFLCCVTDRILITSPCFHEGGFTVRKGRQKCQHQIKKRWNDSADKLGCDYICIISTIYLLSCVIFTI